MPVRPRVFLIPFLSHAPQPGRASTSIGHASSRPGVDSCLSAQAKIFALPLLQRLLSRSRTALAIVLGTLPVAHIVEHRAARENEDAHLLQLRLELLRSQMEMHFLSNTLNTIIVLVRPDPDKAEQALTSLHRLLRHRLEGSPEQVVSLQRELENVEHYMTIMCLRFEDVLDFGVDVTPEISRVTVPAFLVVDLLENAFTHGGIGPDGRFLVTLTARLEQQRLLLGVENSTLNQATISRASSGVGLGNMTDRLRAIYDQDYWISSAPLGGCRWRTTIELPIRYPPRLAVGHARKLS